MTVNVGPDMEAIFALVPKEFGIDRARRAALCVQATIDDFAIDTGLLDPAASAGLSAAIAIQLETEGRLNDPAT